MFPVFVSAIDLAGKLVTSALTFVPHWGAVSREFEANLSDLVTRTSRMPAFLLRENFALKIEHSNLNPYQALLMRSLQICSNISWSCCWKLWSESRCAQYISNLGIFFPLVSFVFMVFQCFLTFSGFLETWNPETGKLTLTGSKGILITCSIWQQFPGFCCFLEFFEFLLFIATVSSAKIDFICKMFGGGVSELNAFWMLLNDLDIFGQFVISFHSFGSQMVIGLEIQIFIWKTRYTSVTQYGYGWQVHPNQVFRNQSQTGLVFKVFSGHQMVLNAFEHLPSFQMLGSPSIRVSSVSTVFIFLHFLGHKTQENINPQLPMYATLNQPSSQLDLWCTPVDHLSMQHSIWLKA